MPWFFKISRKHFNIKNKGEIVKNKSENPKPEIKQRVQFYVNDTTKTYLLKEVKGSGLSVSSYMSQMVTRALQKEGKSS